MQGAGAAPVRAPPRITAPLPFGPRQVAPVANGFLGRCPDVTVELVLNDRNLDLIEEAIDLACASGRLRTRP